MQQVQLQGWIVYSNSLSHVNYSFGQFECICLMHTKKLFSLQVPYLLSWRFMKIQL